MKKIIIGILTILLLFQARLFPQFSFSDLFEMKRISADFYGSVSNGNSILVYGEGGVILRTTDIGNTWEQINLNDFLNIRQIFTINSTYYGNGSIGIIKSTDNGKSWSLHRLDEKIIKAFSFEGKVLCVTSNNVLVLDTNLNIIKKMKIRLDKTYEKPSKDNSFIYCLELLHNKLVFYSKQGKLAFMNAETGELSEITLKNYKPINNVDLLISFDVLKKGNEEILFVNEYDILSFNINRDSIDHIYKIPDTLDPKKFVLLPKSDTLYAMFTYTNKVINWDSLTYSPYLDSVYFGYIDPLSKEFVNIKDVENDRSINDLRFYNLSIHKIGGSQLIVAVGLGKLIYVSYDEGKHWELKSLLNIPFLVSNDFMSLNFKAPIFVFRNNKTRIVTETGKFYATNNGGTTWLPQKNYLPKKERYHFDFGVFLDSLKGIFIADDPGRLLPDGQIIIPPRVFFTLDGGETVKYRGLEISNSSILYLRERIAILKPFGQYILTRGPGYIYFMDDSLGIRKSIYHERKGIPILSDSMITFVDSLYLTSFFEYNDTLWALSPELVDYKLFYKYNRVNVYTSSDTGITWQKSFSFEIPDWHNTLIETFSQNKDSLFLLFTQASNSSPPNTQALIVLLDLKNRNSKVFVKPFLIGDLILKLCNGFYIFYVKTEGLTSKQGVLFFKNWEGEKLNYQELEISRFVISTNSSNPYYQTVSCEPPDSIFAFIVFDNYLGKEALYFAKVRPCVEIEVPRTNSKDFYVSSPYPNPAEDIAKFRIYFNSSESTETLSIDAYDCLGRKVSDASSFNVTPLNSFSLEVTWNTIGLSPGVYMVVATLNGKVSSNKVVLY